MKKVTLPVWQCDHCGRIYKLPCTCKKHEDTCKENPENQHPCFDCYYLKEEKIEFYYDLYGEPTCRDIKTFKCEKYDQLMYSHKAKMRRHPCSTDGEHVQMPLKCENYISDYDYYRRERDASILRMAESGEE